MSEFDRIAEWKRYLVWFAVAISLVICADLTAVKPGLLFDKEGLANAGNLLRGFVHPDFSQDYLLRILQLSFESLFVGILGTVMAVAVGVALCVGAMRIPDLPDPPGKTTVWDERAAQFLRWLARFFLGFLRSIPEIVWAYLFVRILGLGPGAAVFAIACTVGGSIGKLYAELAEAVDPRIIAGLRASGAGRWAILLYGVLPQVRRQWVAYALFRMECNIRAGTVLGVVGAGGLGSEIALNIRYFEFDKLATTLLAVLLLVIALELVSAYLRKKPVKWPLGFAFAGAVASVIYLDIPWRDLFGGDVAGIVAFNAAEVNGSFIAKIAGLTAQTLLMAWVATIVAALFAFVLAPMATDTLTTKSYLRDAYRQRGWSRHAAHALLWGTRLLLQVSRAMPELTLALIFVVWVGPGALAGILAIAVHNIGVLGRLYTDIYEEVEEGPPIALQAAGTGPLGVWLFGVLPQVAPRIVAFTLYRFEVNVRATATVGFVGAGGIGDALHTAISLFHVQDLTLLMLVMLIIVTAVDYVGDLARRRLLRGPGTKHHAHGNSAQIALVDAREADCVRSLNCIEASVHYRLNRKKAFKPTRPSAISVRGMYITSARPYPSGMVLQLEVSLPGTDGTHYGLAKVTKVVTDAGAQPTSAGMVVEFINPSPGFLAAVDKLPLFLPPAAKPSEMAESRLPATAVPPVSGLTAA